MRGRLIAMIVIFDGFAFGMLLFVLSVGLSVTLGLMNFINLAHCAFGMLGGYVAVLATRELGLPFLAGAAGGFLAAALVGVVFERTLFRRLYRAGELNQVLFTIGLVFVASAAAAYLFGTGQQPIQLPDFLRGSVEIGRHALRRLSPVPDRRRARHHRLARLRTGVHALRRQVRAAVDNQRMAQGLGLDVDTIFAVTFALGCGLAGLGGALAIEIVGLDPSFALPLPRLRADRRFGRRARLDRRLVRRRRRCLASATSPASISSRRSAPSSSTC